MGSSAGVLAGSIPTGTSARAGGGSQGRGGLAAPTREYKRRRGISSFPAASIAAHTHVGGGTGNNAGVLTGRTTSYDARGVPCRFFGRGCMG